ncbi:MAG: sulfurtransferase [Myxococcales bacterium]|nr:sulfurtransferase [Myxococcales bacterium]
MARPRPWSDLRVVDVRWSLSKRGRDAYAAGHVEGAAFLDLDVDLSAPSGPGRHPMPERAQLERVFGAIGVDATTHVVAYDDAGGAIAARVWFLLRRYGHERVSILDGGFPAWVAAGGPVSTDGPSFEPQALSLAAPQRSDVVDKAFVERLALGGGVGRTLLLDARARERYRGDTEPVDARPGHIPSAVNAPFADLLVTKADGTTGLKSKSELEAYFRSLGAGAADDIVVYCGSGVTACLDVLALERAGFAALIYEGSYSDWARDDRLPVALGDR